MALALMASMAVELGAWAQTSPAPVFLTHPSVVDTAHLKGGDTTVALFGVQGWGGDPARELQSVIAQAGDKVTCEPEADQTYACKLPTGADVGELALATGAAKTLAGAPADYHTEEAAAEAAHRGLWASQVPGPEILQHPTVQTTSEVSDNGRIYPLAGIEGFQAPYYTLQLQEFVDSHGGRLSCEQKAGSDRYVCSTLEGTDIATVALLEGLARVRGDAPPEYRNDQAQAVSRKSGFWFNPPQQVLTQLASPPGTGLPPDFSAPATPNFAPSIAYDDGIPVAVIDTAPVFFVFIPNIGWGYYDHLGRWSTAPARYRAELQRAHPGGADGPGLGRAFRTPAASAATGLPRVTLPESGRFRAAELQSRPGAIAPAPIARVRPATPPEGFGGVGSFRPAGPQGRPGFIAPATIGRVRPVTPLTLPRPSFAGIRPGGFPATLGGIRPITLGLPHPAGVPALVGRR